MKGMSVNVTRRWFVMAAVFSASLMSFAATTVKVLSVQQRWPWNNKLDITYEVNGGQDLSSSTFYKIVFTTVIEGVTYTIDGVTDVGASANAGTNTVVWTAPSGIVSTNCTMSARLYPSDTPSGDDYLIVDLKTGAVWYEGMLVSQDASNRRYNTDLYKGKDAQGAARLVLRKVPQGVYQTGDNVNYSTSNTSKSWRTHRAYYVGVFPVTQYQYKELCGSNPAQKTAEITGNPVEQRPVEYVSWKTLRGTIAPTARIPFVTSKTGTFFQRLNYLTGNRYYFDLPTEVMSEIAQRAGATTVYSWGGSLDEVTRYCVCKNNSNASTVAVGSRDPNAWGLYDTAGNVWELCLDAKGLANLALAVDPFTPHNNPSSMVRRMRGGGNWNADYTTSLDFRASRRNEFDRDDVSPGVGFRVAFIVD